MLSLLVSAFRKKSQVIFSIHLVLVESHNMLLLLFLVLANVEMSTFSRLLVLMIRFGAVTLLVG